MHFADSLRKGIYSKLKNNCIRKYFRINNLNTFPSPKINGGNKNKSFLTSLEIFQFSSVQSLSSVRLFQPHELQHARPPCPLSAPRVYLNSCPLSRWCHPAISSSVIPFSSSPQPLPASRSFPMSQFFTWGGQSIELSASASVLPMKTQDWSPLGWTGWISL